MTCWHLKPKFHLPWGRSGDVTWTAWHARCEKIASLRCGVDVVLGARLQIDFSRRHEGEVGTVERLEYDPNRTARIALVKYPEGTSSCFYMSPATVHMMVARSLAEGMELAVPAF